MTKTLDDKINNLVKSSVFNSNDVLSFSVPVVGQGDDSTSLPGRNCPKDYLDGIGINEAPNRAAVICPGNGGLVSELFLRGADTVDCFEPRYLYFDGLKASIKLLGESDNAVNTQNCRLFFDWPKKDGDEKYDLILFPEGLNYPKSPFSHIRNIIDLLDTSGVLFIEFVLGRHKNMAGPINSWSPDKGTFLKFMKDCCDVSVEEIGPGRLENSAIFKMTHELLVIDGNNDNIEIVKSRHDSISKNTNGARDGEVKDTKSDASKSKSTEKKRRKLIEDGLFDETSLDEAIDAFGPELLDQALKSGKVSKNDDSSEEKQESISKKTKTKKRKRRVASDKKSKTKSKKSKTKGKKSKTKSKSKGKKSKPGSKKGGQKPKKMTSKKTSS